MGISYFLVKCDAIVNAEACHLVTASYITRHSFSLLPKLTTIKKENPLRISWRLSLLSSESDVLAAHFILIRKKRRCKGLFPAWNMPSSCSMGVYITSGYLLHLFLSATMSSAVVTLTSYTPTLRFATESKGVAVKLVATAAVMYAIKLMTRVLSRLVPELLILLFYLMHATLSVLHINNVSAPSNRSIQLRTIDV